jgi:ABC-type antimicrobial peptide transport system permease subunit
LALALGTVGIYGTMAVLVQQRRREIAIRMAVGGERTVVVNFILRQGMRWVVAGMFLGLAASALVTRLLQGFLYGISVADPVVFSAVPLLLAGTAYLACFLPARRTSMADPLPALREE